MRIAVIFDRLGPYHVARLNALAARCDLTAIELTEMDKTYAWDKVTQGCDFNRRTLFAGGASDAQVREQLPVVLAQALNSEAPDAVAAPGWGFPGALIALDWCLRKKVPAILMTESQRTDHDRSPFKEWVKSRVVRRYASALVGGQTSADYAAGLGMPRERIFPGYDVVDNGYFERGAELARGDAGARQALGLPSRFWLASGRFVPQKNLPLLLKAFARYRASEGSAAYDLVLLGDGPLKPELLALRQSLGLDSSLHFPGFAQYHQLPAYYGLASAFVHVSTIEPWGLVINEAMAARLPVLASDACGCVPDLVRDGHNGFLFNPQDEDALVRAMQGLGRLGADGLDAMGRRGQALLRDWSPALFGDSMMRAAEAGLQSRRPVFTAPSRLFLKGLARLRAAA